MSGWQPIETAPRARAGGRMPEILVSDGRYVMVAWWNLAAERWYNTSCHLIVGQPTHWQHLPDAPVQS